MTPAGELLSSLSPLLFSLFNEEDEEKEREGRKGRKEKKIKKLKAQNDGLRAGFEPQIRASNIIHNIIALHKK